MGTQGLNVYEIRAAFRLIRCQPEQIPPLESFKQLTIQNKRQSIDNCINSQFMSKQWLKEKNMNLYDEENENKEEDEDDNDADIESSEDEQVYFSSDSMSEQTFEQSLSSGPRTSSLENILKRMTMKQNDEENKRRKLRPKLKKPQKRYTDFFDDNESTESAAESVSESIHINKLFEVIVMSSPPLNEMIALYSTDNGDDGADSSMPFGLQRSDDNDKEQNEES